MMRKVWCVESDGFEDQMTKGAFYEVQNYKNGSYLIINDNGKARWYGTVSLKPAY